MSRGPAEPLADVMFQLKCEVRSSGPQAEDECEPRQSWTYETKQSNAKYKICRYFNLNSTVTTSPFQIVLVESPYGKFACGSPGTASFEFKFPIRVALLCCPLIQSFDIVYDPIRSGSHTGINKGSAIMFPLIIPSFPVVHTPHPAHLKYNYW